MNINEEFDFEDMYNFLNEDLTLIIIGDQSDERAKFVLNRFKGSNKAIIQIKYTFETQVFTLIQLNQDDVIEKKCQEYKIGDCIRNFHDIDTRSVLVDISGMQHSVILSVTKNIILKLHPEKLFASYAKPGEYINKNELGEYEFSEYCRGVSCVPGFLKTEQDDSVFIPLLGFEGKRLCNFLEPNNYYEICPIIGFPSDEPFWQFESLRNCMHEIKDNDNYFEIKKCRAYSVFDAIDTITSIAECNQNNPLVLAPLGTRPHTLACAIFATMNFKKCRLLYDYPQEKSIITKGIRDVTVYHLSSFIA